MAGESFDTNQAFNDIVSQFLLGLNWVKVNIQRINFFLLVSPHLFCEFYSTRNSLCERRREGWLD
uniref:Uncharacterized protein n=1 Tax=Ascaris lumbricoides TaxID=6252 RepID=A0A0M3HLR4_ASCLU